jgi:uncharacterized membrane protein
MDDFSREIEIHAPVELCYQLWREGPTSIHPDISVERLRDNAWRSTLAGPHGDTITWDTRLVEEVPNQRLVWKSTGEPAFEIWADQNYVRLAPDRTKIIVNVSFESHHMLLSGLYESLYAWPPEFVIQMLNAFKTYAEDIYQQILAQEQAQDLSQQEKKQIRHSVPSR